jgi:hypothetical protein
VSERFDAADDKDRLRRFLCGSVDGATCLSLDWDLDAFVDIVETEMDDEIDLDQLRFDLAVALNSASSFSRCRPLSSSFFANCSSAIPFLMRCQRVFRVNIQYIIATDFRKRS